jgi:arylsulfatase A-like enzyme
MNLLARPLPLSNLLSLLVVSFVSPVARAAEEVPTRPNIVLILADDLGYGDPGCYNADSRIPTPNIDRLAAAGMRFTDAHTPSSVCTPTRYGVLTGRYAWRTRLKSGVLNGYSPALIEPGRTTLASLLAAYDYRTACVGKWHLGLGNAAEADYAQALAPGPNSVGFDEAFIVPASLDMPPYVFVHNERPSSPPVEHIDDSKMRRHGGGGFWRAGAIAADFQHVDTLPVLTEHAVGFIEQQSDDAPFFLYFPLTAPHTPWMPTDEFRGRTQVDCYGDFVAQVDATVGRVLDTLAKQQLADHTLVIFTSDNGAHWLPSDIEQFEHRANAHWRGQKADIWEGGHRVPLVMRWPGIIAANSVSDQLTCLTDIMATLAAIVGAELPAGAGEDSYSVLPVMLGQGSTAPLREAIVHHSVDGTFAIRRGPWKLAMRLGSHGFSAPKNIKPTPGGAQGQLVHLGNDPAEQHNRWLAQPRIVAELTQLLTQYQQSGRSRPAK